MDLLTRQQRRLWQKIGRCRGLGRLFIANPDLPERFRLDAPLNPLDEANLYGGARKGYTDYPVMGPQLVEDDEH